MTERSDNIERPKSEAERGVEEHAIAEYLRRVIESHPEEREKFITLAEEYLDEIQDLATRNKLREKINEYRK